MTKFATTVKAPVEAQFEKAIALYRNGRLGEARILCERIVSVSPKNIPALELSGLISLLEQRFADAVALFTKLITINPQNSNSYVNRGVALKALGEIDAAIQSYDSAISLKPKDAKPHYNRANCFIQLKKYDEAIDGYKKAIDLNPKYVEAYANLGSALLERGQCLDSAHALRIAINIDPEFLDAHYTLGKALHKLEKYEQAIDAFDRTIELKNLHYEAHNDRGLALQELEKFDEALASYDKAIALNSDKAEAYCNRGIVLKELKRLDDSLASYDKAITLNPDYAEAHYNRGNVLKDLKRLDESLASYDKAIALKADCAEAYWNKSLLLLLRGQFREGWELYDWRWKTNVCASKPLLTGKPLFNYKDRGRVLVWAEQGIGDEIMFGSMIPEFKESCAQLIVQVDPRLIPLFSRSLSEDIVILSKKITVPEELYDQHIPMGSLGKYSRTDNAGFSRSRFGYLNDDSNKTNEIRQSLVSKNRQKICGISWRSKNERTGADRSMTLIDFLASLSLADYSFISLQYGETLEEIKSAREELGVDIKAYDRVDNFNDLDGLASLIQACDVVVSVDNSTVHLAGAIGKDVRILLPYSPDWRWQLERDDNPWYASAKLYRQSSDGDWSSAFNKIRSDLRMAIPSKIGGITIQRRL